MTCATYCEKIEEIFDAMIRLAYEVLPENRKEVNRYIANAWTHTTVFVQSINREKGTDELRSKFESHVTAEEARLQRNFEDIKYDIDSYDTVQLIAGEGRVEMVIEAVCFPVSSTILNQIPIQTLFPMLYLALKRDLERISLAQKYVLSIDEMDDAFDTIQYITDAAWYRIMSLRSKPGNWIVPLWRWLISIGIFEQQNLDANDQFGVFAKGLVRVFAFTTERYEFHRLRVVQHR